MSEQIQQHLIDGKTRSVRDLFSAAHYGIDFYQREYAWNSRNLDELLEDLTRSFLKQFDATDSRDQVKMYRPYFLGPIVTHVTAEKTYLVDGQQRMTTLSLLLFHLSTITSDSNQATQLKSLIYSYEYGSYRFTIDVDDRNPMMTKLLDGLEIDSSSEEPSIKNMAKRHDEIRSFFTDDKFSGAKLTYFIDWLLNRVQLVEIQTLDRNMALEVFESMNDRGLQLTNMDMLKSFLLSCMNTANQTEISLNAWRSTVSSLTSLDKNADSEFMKVFLRARFARSVRERNKGALAKDFELIGTSFHKWFRDNARELGIAHPDQFESFVCTLMPKYAKWYEILLDRSKRPVVGWEHVFFNAHNNFTLQYMVILSAASPSDTEETFQAKASLIAKYLDLVIARRMVNYKIYGYSPMYFQMFGLALEVRDRPVGEIQNILATKVSAINEDFDGIEVFRLNQGNRPNVKYLLARITAWFEAHASENDEAASDHDQSVEWQKYFAQKLSDPFEIEHVWANHYERHVSEYSSEAAFQEARNSFGNLLLLPKSVNASLSDATLEEKISHYIQHNALAKVTSPTGVEKNPNLRKKLNSITTEAPYLDLTPEEGCVQLNNETVKDRCIFYRQVCEEIWDPANLGLAR